MIIEFTDPGYNWAFLWWPLGVFIALMGVFVFLGIALEWDETDPVLGITGSLMLVSVFAAVFIPVAIGTTDYGFKVRDSQTRELTAQGFTDVSASSDRFTAATEDGQYFRGVLVDLKPDEGYAYQVLEITGTEN